MAIRCLRWPDGGKSGGESGENDDDDDDHRTEPVDTPPLPDRLVVVWLRLWVFLWRTLPSRFASPSRRTNKERAYRWRCQRWNLDLLVSGCRFLKIKMSYSSRHYEEKMRRERQKLDSRFFVCYLGIAVWLLHLHYYSRHLIWFYFFKKKKKSNRNPTVCCFIVWLLSRPSFTGCVSLGSFFNHLTGFIIIVLFFYFTEFLLRFSLDFLFISSLVYLVHLSTTPFHSTYLVGVLGFTEFFFFFHSHGVSVALFFTRLIPPDSSTPPPPGPSVFVRLSFSRGQRRFQKRKKRTYTHNQRMNRKKKRDRERARRTNGGGMEEERKRERIRTKKKEEKKKGKSGTG